MRLVLSDKVKELDKLIDPYREWEGLDWHIKESAPDNIKRIAEEWRKLVDEEFRQAKEMIF